MLQKRDYLPPGEEDFNRWQKNLVELVQKNLAAWQIPVNATDSVLEAKAIYDPAYEAANVGKRTQRSTEQVKAKEDATEAYKVVLRQFVKEWLAFNSNITDAQRRALLITVKDTTRTLSSVPETIPDLFLVPFNGSSIELTVRQQPDAEGRSRRGRPADSMGFEVAIFVGDNPPPATDCLDKRSFTRSPQMLEFDSKLTGKLVTVYGRWIGKGLQKGKWSQSIQEAVTK